MSALFHPESRYPWSIDESRFDYKEDKTQWVKPTPPIEIKYGLCITKDDDPALISFVEKIAERSIQHPTVSLIISHAISDDDTIDVSVTIDNEKVDDKAAKEILKRISDSQLLFLYNSTTHQEDFYLARGRRRMFYEFVMSAEEKKALDEVGKVIERKLRRLAKEHTQGLSEILGKLTEKYEVEVSTPENYGMRRMPLGINLRDRHVEVPLNDWGSGTQNRTQILMAILQANRIKRSASPDDKITPVVVVEEPESFLHPSAQAEFGKILRHLSSEFGIQIIVTTHSPHMLNQEEPKANILLTRKVIRKKAFATEVVDTDGDSWMAPFADHLGIGNEEFLNLRPLFSGDKSRVLLVEGESDQEYFRFLQNNSLACEKLDASIEVVPYGGKDTLKNTLLVQFVLRKFDRVFVTYDLDVDTEIRNALNRLGLRISIDYAPIGIEQPGKKCIEGLLPQSVLSAVTGRETDLVMKLTSTNSQERRAAKDQLKRAYLAEFIKRDDYQPEELKELAKVVRRVNARLIA
jgi:putative ATP-dependent endonuclease of the OLD family